ncbi:unnamed protein product [Rangifer tarandus platyrhynchus]|uniref:Uncharacterized protein n=1 Tax=Rangifer tarandus platyrhynchus TaxID=3082113 RepID=A0AC59Y8E6_RANTA
MLGCPWPPSSGGGRGAREGRLHRKQSSGAGGQEMQWYESQYALPLGRKKGAKLTSEEEEILNKKRSKKIQKKYDERKKNAKISSLLEEHFQQGKLLACIASRPGQCGRADGYVLEGKELEFYLRKIKARKCK